MADHSSSRGQNCRVRDRFRDTLSSGVTRPARSCRWVRGGAGDRGSGCASDRSRRRCHRPALRQGRPAAWRPRVVDEEPQPAAVSGSSRSRTASAAYLSASITSSASEAGISLEDLVSGHAGRDHVDDRCHRDAHSRVQRFAHLVHPAADGHSESTRATHGVGPPLRDTAFVFVRRIGSLVENGDLSIERARS